jgi:hypothetical protein
MTQPRRTRARSTEPFPGYDNLTASEIVSRLSTLSSSKRAAVEAYERAHAGRKTVLTRAARQTASARRPTVDLRRVKD